jgi:hypothetical protein
LKSVSSVCITSDIWSGHAKEDYLSVVIHFVSVDWELEKRVIGPRLIDVSHSGVNIVECVEDVVTEFGLKDKIFSITLDNVVSNAFAMAKLIPKFLLVTLILTLNHLTKTKTKHCVVSCTSAVHVTL